MSFLDSLYHLFLPTSPSAPPSDGPTSETHAAQDAVVRSSLDGSTALLSGAAATGVDLVALLKTGRIKVTQMIDQDFAHPTHPYCVRFYAEVPGHGSVKAGGWQDHSWFKMGAGTVDIFAQVESTKASKLDALRLFDALSSAHGFQLRKGMLDKHSAYRWIGGVWQEPLYL